jgi:hypothetical protein
MMGFQDYRQQGDRPWVQQRKVWEELEESQIPSDEALTADKDYMKHIIAHAPVSRAECVDGPLEGTWLDVPPGGSQVLLPGGFADPKWNLNGQIIYELRDGCLHYVGQPDQEDADHADPEEEEPKLWTPSEV